MGLLWPQMLHEFLPPSLLSVSTLSFVVLFLLLRFYHHFSSPSFPLCPCFLPLLLVLLSFLLSSSSSPLLFLPGIAATAVPPEPPQEVGPEAAEGAGVASGPVSRSDVLLQAAGQEEGARAVLAAVGTLHVVAAHHVADGKTCITQVEV